VSQERLPLICLDHFPLIVNSVNGPRGKRLFKFENMWQGGGFWGFSEAMVGFLSFFFYKSEEFLSKSANLKGVPPNYTKSITKNA
jgi:hypothetical protein